MTVRELREVLASMEENEEVVMNVDNGTLFPIRSYHVQYGRVVLRNHLIAIARTEFKAFDGGEYEADVIDIRYQMKG